VIGLVESPVTGDLTGRTIAQDRVAAKMGEGGMGQVYRATDTKLKRDVAIESPTWGRPLPRNGSVAQGIEDFDAEPLRRLALGRRRG